MLPEDAFIANEAHWFTLDVVYLVFVRSGAIVGARVGGQLIGTEFGEHPDDPRSYARADLLRRCLAADPLDPRFTDLDRKNFRYSISEIREARFSTRRALWTGGVPNSGSITLLPRAGRRRRLILLGRQDLRAIHALLVSGGIPASPLAP